MINHRCSNALVLLSVVDNNNLKSLRSHGFKKFVTLFSTCVMTLNPTKERWTNCKLLLLVCEFPEFVSWKFQSYHTNDNTQLHYNHIIIIIYWTEVHWYNNTSNEINRSAGDLSVLHATIKQVTNNNSYTVYNT